MQIIFGDHVDKVRDRFTVLELDTFVIEGTDTTIQSWCVVENIPLTEMPLTESLQKLHRDLIQQYRKKNWNYCRSAIEKLTGRWNSELDSFYANLLERVEHYSANQPTDDWTGYLVKSLKG